MASLKKKSVGTLDTGEVSSKRSSRLSAEILHTSVKNYVRMAARVSVIASRVSSSAGDCLLYTLSFA